MEPIESGQIRLILKPTWPDKTGKAWHVSRAGSKNDSVPMKTIVPKQEFEAILDRFMLISILWKQTQKILLEIWCQTGPLILLETDCCHAKGQQKVHQVALLLRHLSHDIFLQRGKPNARPTNWWVLFGLHVMLNAKFEYGTKPFFVVIIFKIGHNLHILQYWIYCLTQRSTRLAQKYALTCFWECFKRRNILTYENSKI